MTTTRDLAALLAAVEEFPGDPAFRRVYADALLDAGQDSEARDQRQAAEALDLIRAEAGYWPDEVELVAGTWRHGILDVDQRAWCVHKGRVFQSRSPSSGADDWTHPDGTGEAWYVRDRRGEAGTEWARAWCIVGHDADGGFVDSWGPYQEEDVFGVLADKCQGDGPPGASVMPGDVASVQVCRTGDVEADDGEWYTITHHEDGTASFERA